MLLLSCDRQEGRGGRQKSDANLMCVFVETQKQLVCWLVVCLFAILLLIIRFVCKSVTTNQQGCWFHVLQFHVVFIPSARCMQT